MIQNSTPEKIVYTWQIKANEDINSSASKAWIHFMMFSVPSLSCLRKLPVHVSVATDKSTRAFRTHRLSYLKMPAIESYFKIISSERDKGTES